MKQKKSTTWLYLKPILSFLALIVVWYVGLTLVLQKTLLKYEVTPSFPYYNELLTRMNEEEAVWGHFDGIHYLRLARYGYQDTGTQAFFPLYPLSVRGIGALGFELEESAYFLNGAFLVLGLIALYFLFKSFWPLILVLSFPTSFFFGTIYTESMFFALSMTFFLCLKNKQYLLAATVAALASGTRLVGVFLGLSLLVDYYLNWRKTNKNKLLSPNLIVKIIALGLVSISGLLAYLYFLNAKWHDPLMFFHVQSMFGAERSSGELVLLPQVLYRYFKMIITVDPASLLYQRIWLELILFLGACFLWFKNLKLIPISWSIYTGLSIILPTLTGTLSSMPRYLLVLVPFLLPSTGKYRIFVFPSLLLLIYLFSIFSRGLFVG